MSGIDAFSGGRCATIGRVAFSDIEEILFVKNKPAKYNICSTEIKGVNH